MPQMAPLNWLTLFVMFSICLMMFSSINYYSFTKNPLKKTTKMKKLTYNWLW
uniref:ATP synthase complex subunit 8 n=1 Tax=Cryptocephalus vittatus TaxID=1425562 RepID=A0A343C2I1_9CUCU|nr:ATP synthase F0 subunit 8 [Cryptocephalus vittatus]ARH54224.1 ATP synthase F0 subunit 8 [Cryptocephalus vittatus]